MLIVVFYCYVPYMLQFSNKYCKNTDYSLVHRWIDYTKSSQDQDNHWSLETSYASRDKPWLVYWKHTTVSHLSRWMEQFIVNVHVYWFLFFVYASFVRNFFTWRRPHYPKMNAKCTFKGGISVVRVQASALDVGSDVTIQRYSFFEIVELILHSCNSSIASTPSRTWCWMKNEA